jgi:hypothetical protein
MNYCPRCGGPCGVRYREVPIGKMAQFVCGRCIADLGLPPGGYSKKNSIELAKIIAVGLTAPPEPQGGKDGG